MDGAKQPPPLVPYASQNMKSLRSILAALFASAAAADQPKPPPKPPAEIMRELRLQWLTRQPTPETSSSKDEVAAVLMDWPLDEQTVTVLASSEGDASVYTTGTFGIMGGIGHENARKAALEFVKSAKTHLSLASPTTDFSYKQESNGRAALVVTHSRALNQLDFELMAESCCRRLKCDRACTSRLITTRIALGNATMTVGIVDER